METTITDVFKKSFIPRVKVKNSTVRGAITDKVYNREKGCWMAEISSVIDGKTYSKIFSVNEIIDATDNNGILKID